MLGQYMFGPWSQTPATTGPQLFSNMGMMGGGGTPLIGYGPQSSPPPGAVGTSAGLNLGSVHRFSPPVPGPQQRVQMPNYPALWIRPPAGMGVGTGLGLAALAAMMQSAALEAGRGEAQHQASVLAPWQAQEAIAGVDEQPSPWASFALGAATPATIAPLLPAPFNLAAASLAPMAGLAGAAFAQESPTAVREQALPRAQGSWVPTGDPVLDAAIRAANDGDMRPVEALATRTIYDAKWNSWDSKRTIDEFSNKLLDAGFGPETIGSLYRRSDTESFTDPSWIGTGGASLDSINTPAPAYTPGQDSAMAGFMNVANAPGAYAGQALKFLGGLF